MKKNNKTVERQPEETIGVDLGDKISRYAILDGEGVVVEEGMFHNRVESIEKHFGDRGRARVALETGAQSAWIARAFEKLGHEVIVANARELKWITSSDNKTDPNDARKLGAIWREPTGICCTRCKHRSPEHQAELGVIRARDAMVRARTLLVKHGAEPGQGFLGCGCRRPSRPLSARRALENLPEFSARIVAWIAGTHRRAGAADQRV